MIRRPPRSTLFPYRRSSDLRSGHDDRARGIVRIRHVECVDQLADHQRVERVELVRPVDRDGEDRSEEHTSELQSRSDLVCRLLLEKKKNNKSRRDTLELVVY